MSMGLVGRGGIPTPPLTPEMRANSRAPAKDTWAARREVLAKLRDRTLAPSGFHNACLDDYRISRITVGTFFRAVAGTRWEKAVDELRLDPEQRMCNLGYRQWKRIIDRWG